MALNIGTRTEGEVLDFRGTRGDVFIARAPDGLEVRIPAPTGRVSLWLPQVGMWRWEWRDAKSGGEFEVVPGVPGDVPVPQEVNYGRIEAG